MLVAVVTGALGIGVLIRLRSGSYRRPDETGPLPRHLWVVPVAPLSLIHI